jgi:hypothetical protein
MHANRGVGPWVEGVSLIEDFNSDDELLQLVTTALEGFFDDELQKGPQALSLRKDGARSNRRELFADRSFINGFHGADAPATAQESRP